MPLDFLPARQERWNYKGNWLTIPWQCLGDNLENPLDWFLVFDSVRGANHPHGIVTVNQILSLERRTATSMPRWYTEIGWELGEEARIYIVNSVTSLEIGSQSTNFRHISYASTGTACATGGKMGERGRGGRG